MAEPRDIPDLQNLVIFCRRKKIPLRVIGAGSNLLINDKGLKGVVVKLDSLCFRRIIPKSPSDKNINKRIIDAGAGASLARICAYARREGLSGLELLAGTPGTLGGALVGNSADIGRHIRQVQVLEQDGKIKVLEKRNLYFTYRGSNLERYIILSARLELIKKNKKTVSNTFSEYLVYRRKTQDFSLPSAGCVFKNPALKNPAAYFIESCGLKGFSIGNAAVSAKHANFIVNKGQASYTDIRKLIACIVQRVQKRFSFTLEPEIKIWNDHG